MKLLVLLLLCFCVSIHSVPSDDDNDADWEKNAYKSCPKYTPKSGFNIDKLLNRTWVTQFALNVPNDSDLNIEPCGYINYTKGSNGTYYGFDYMDGKYHAMEFPQGSNVGFVTYTVPKINSTTETVTVEQYFLDFDSTLLGYQVWTLCFPIMPDVVVFYVFVNHPVLKDISDDTMKTISDNLNSIGFSSKTVYNVQSSNCTYPNV